MRTVRNRRFASEGVSSRRPGRPVMLATLGVPFEAEAVELAVDTAVETGESLLVVNVVQIPPLPAAIMGYEIEDSEEDAAALRAPAALAQSLGVEVERLRLRSPHQLDALIDVVRERRPGLLVFGPDRNRLKGRVYRKAAQTIRERAACLLWLAN